jgi:hypothetical protein
MVALGISTLIGKKFILVGFSFAKHPQKAGWFSQFSIYQGKNSFVLCNTEGPGKGNVDAAKQGLGKEVKGEDIMRFAKGNIEGANLQAVKHVMKEIPLFKEWHWYE